MNKNFITSYLHVHGKLITKIGQVSLISIYLRSLVRFFCYIEHQVTLNHRSFIDKLTVARDLLFAISVGRLIKERISIIASQKINSHGLYSKTYFAIPFAKRQCDTQCPDPRINLSFICSMETFHESASRMLCQFRALLHRQPLPTPAARLLQLTALNMFAVETTVSASKGTSKHRT